MKNLYCICIVHIDNRINKYRIEIILQQNFLFKNKLTNDVIDYFCIIKSKLSHIVNTNFDNKSNIKFFAGYPLT